jgi:hypothetical protein
MSTSLKPTIAGVINIMSGVLTLIGFFLFFFISIAVIVSVVDFNGADVTPELASGLIFGLSGIFLITGILSIYGGMCALHQDKWGWALAGSIGSFLIELPLGIVSIVLLVLSRDDFTSRVKEKEVENV